MKVIFRKWPEGTVIALLPEMPANRGRILFQKNMKVSGEKLESIYEEPIEIRSLLPRRFHAVL